MTIRLPKITIRVSANGTRTPILKAFPSFFPSWNLYCLTALKSLFQKARICNSLPSTKLEAATTNMSKRFFLTRVGRYKDRFDLQVIADGFLAVYSSARASGNSHASIRQSIGYRIVAIHLSGSVAELFGDLGSPF